MTPIRGPYERRRYRRLHMATQDCGLTLMGRLGDDRQREACILIDLSYAGLRFNAHRPLAAGEVIELVIDIHSPVRRSGLVKARIRWVRPIGLEECDAGAEFSEESKGLMLGPEEPRSGTVSS